MNRTITMTLLPSQLSDEAAFELAEFLHLLSIMASAKYAEQIHRHREHVLPLDSDGPYFDDEDDGDGPPF